MKVRDHNWQSRIFLKIPACQKIDQPKRAKMGQFVHFSVTTFSGLANFFFFFEILPEGNPKLIKPNFFGKCLPESRAKTQNGPICVFIRYDSFFGIGSLIFLYFACNWVAISIQNWRSRIFLKNVLLLWRRSKMPQMVKLSVRPLWQHFFSGLAH